MKFTTSLLALALAAAGVSAAPSSQLLERQAGTVFVEFYARDDCTGTIVEDTTFFDDGSDTCRVNDITATYQSFKVVRNEATRTLNFYDRTNCTTKVPPTPAGHVISVPSGTTGCFHQQVGSTQFGNPN